MIMGFMDESGSSGVANNANDFLVVSLANLLIREVIRHTKDARILLDSNPVLCERLKRSAKSEKLHGLKFKQAKSHADNLLQLADYVAALSFKRAKGAEKSIGVYRSIAKKQLAFLEISA